MKLGVFMLWTEMREPPKALPLNLEDSPRSSGRASVSNPTRSEAGPPDVRKARPAKKRRASIIADEATAS